LKSAGYGENKSPHAEDAFGVIPATIILTVIQQISMYFQ
jgi:hypothetical protein